MKSNNYKKTTSTTEKNKSEINKIIHSTTTSLNNEKYYSAQDENSVYTTTIVKDFVFHGQAPAPLKDWNIEYKFNTDQPDLLKNDDFEYLIESGFLTYTSSQIKKTIICLLKFVFNMDDNIVINAKNIIIKDCEREITYCEKDISELEHSKKQKKLLREYNNNLAILKSNLEYAFAFNENTNDVRCLANLFFNSNNWNHYNYSYDSTDDISIDLILELVFRVKKYIENNFNVNELNFEFEEAAPGLITISHSDCIFLNNNQTLTLIELFIHKNNPRAEVITKLLLDALTYSKNGYTVNKLIVVNPIRGVWSLDYSLIGRDTSEHLLSLIKYNKSEFVDSRIINDSYLFCRNRDKNVSLDISKKTDFELLSNNENLYPVNVGKEMLSKVRVEILSYVGIKEKYLELEGYEIEDINSDSAIAINYISDLHLDTKIIKCFGNTPTLSDVKEYIMDAVNHLVASCIKRDIVIIAGDVSSNFEITKLFYQCLMARLSRNLRQQIPLVMVTLGNHELWNFQSNYEYKDILAQYEELFSSLNIIFLNNSLIRVFKEPNNASYSFEIINDSFLRNSNEIELNNLKISTSLFVLGGLGFSSYSDMFTAEDGLYQDVINNDQELHETEVLHDLYSLVNEKLKDCRVICATHMALRDWMKEPEYNPNWFYVSGHTHKNYLHIDESRAVFENNQVGNDGEKYEFKFFTLDRTYNLLAHYENGIYDVPTDLYKRFYAGIGKNMTFDYLVDHVTMIKRENVYLFLINNNKKGEYYLLQGGKKIKIKNQDLNYYYDNMTTITQSLKMFSEMFMDYIKPISEEIRLLGGSGKIHGCIVDVDFYHHIYVNPFDGSLTAYKATDIVNKRTYKNVKSMLDDMKLLKGSTSNALKIISEDEIITHRTEQNNDTFIYKCSNAILNLQRMEQTNVLTFWNDDMVQSNSSPEFGKLLLSYM